MGTCTVLLGSIYFFLILTVLSAIAGFAERIGRPTLFWAAAGLACPLLLTPAFILGLLVGTAGQGIAL